MLDALRFVDTDSVSEFILKCQSRMGGFSKFPDMYPDVLHSYYSVCWFSMIGDEGFESLNCSLGMSFRALRSANFIEIPSD